MEGDLGGIFSKEMMGRFEVEFYPWTEEMRVYSQRLGGQMLAIPFGPTDAEALQHSDLEIPLLGSSGDNPVAALLKFHRDAFALFHANIYLLIPAL